MLYYLVYGIEPIFSVEIEVRSIHVMMETSLFEQEWAEKKFKQLPLLDEKRIRVLYRTSCTRRG